MVLPASERVPIEVWRIIFQYALHVEDGLVVQYRSPIDRHRLRDPDITVRDDIHVQLFTAKSISSTCKDWHNNSHDITLNTLSISRLSILGWKHAMLNLHLRKTRLKMPTKIEKLIFFCNDTAPERCQMAINFIRKCPKVIHLFARLNLNHWPDDLRDEFFDEISHVQAPNLSTIRWMSSIGGIGRSLVNVLSFANNLTHLQISTFITYDYDATISVELPSLHTLEIISSNETDVDLDIFLSWIMLNLRYVIINTIARAPSLDSRFFKKHGGKLTILEYTYALNNPQPILDLCPSLEDLIIHLDNSQEPYEFRHANLRRIGLRGHERLFSYQDTPFNKVSQWVIRYHKNRLPRLHTMHIINFHQNHFKMPSFPYSLKLQWRRLQLHLELNHARLTDFEGSPVRAD